MKQLIEDLISAMEYHVAQTRPVHMTTVAIQAAKDALKAMPAAQPAPVQEPVSALTNLRVPKERINEIQGGLMAHYSSGAQAPKDLLFAASDCIGALTLDLIDANRAAPHPVPVKTYHDGKPWPVAPKPWVGLTADEMLEALTSVDPETKRLPVGFSRFACAIEAKLRSKNHDQ